MVASTAKQRPERQAVGPGPDHSPGAWIMEDEKLDSAANSMTAEQARVLKNLARKGREPDAFQKNLSSEGAEVRIRILRAKLAKDKGGQQHKPN
jgi:hypothetical protein